MTIFSNTSETEHLGNCKRLKMNHLFRSLIFHALCASVPYKNQGRADQDCQELVALMPKSESDKSDTSSAATVAELSRDFRACCNGDHIFYRISSPFNF